jgi:hypothetical protein
MLWESTTHDREPVSGLAEYMGTHGWFQAVFDELQDDYEYPRRMVLYELNDDEVAYEWRAHKVWEMKGSTKQCRHADIPSPPAGTGSSLAEFYAEFPPHPLDVYTDHPVIGWFWAAEG